MKEKYSISHPITHRLQKCQITTQYWWKKCIKDSPLYLLGVVLQPHLRKNFLRQWANTYGEELVHTAEEKMYPFWEEYRQTIAVETPQPSPSLSRSPSPDLDHNQKRSILTSKLNALTVQPVQPSDEFLAYLQANLDFELAKLEIMQRKAYEKSKSKQSPDLLSNFPKIPTVIQWWYKQRKTWPTLANFAIEILSIAAMSDDVERVFSGARRTVSWDRARIGIDKVEAIECLGSWLPCKFETMIDRLEGIQAEEIEEMEEIEEIEGDEDSGRVTITIEDTGLEEDDEEEEDDDELA